MIPGSRAAEEFSLNSWKPGVSAVVVCFNEEDNIGSCLESVKWCDAIIVVESFARIGLSKSVAAIRTVLRSVCGKGIATSCPLPFPWQRKSGF